MLIGYARVSTLEQRMDMQVDELTKAGCEKIFSDVYTGANMQRKGLQDALSFARAGDTIVIWRLDRLGRSLKDLVDLMNELIARDVGLKSLCEGIDSTTTAGKLAFHLFASLAEFERNVIRDRCLAGLEAARARGRIGGRRKVMDDDKYSIAKQLYDAKKIPMKRIAETVGVSITTLYREFSRRQVE